MKICYNIKFLLCVDRVLISAGSIAKNTAVPYCFGSSRWTDADHIFLKSEAKYIPTDLLKVTAVDVALHYHFVDKITNKKDGHQHLKTVCVDIHSKRLPLIQSSVPPPTRTRGHPFVSAHPTAAVVVASNLSIFRGKRCLECEFRVERHPANADRWTECDQK